MPVESNMDLSIAPLLRPTQRKRRDILLVAAERERNKGARRRGDRLFRLGIIEKDRGRTGRHSCPSSHCRKSSSPVPSEPSLDSLLHISASLGPGSTFLWPLLTGSRNATQKGSSSKEVRADGGLVVVVGGCRGPELQLLLLSY